VTAPVVDDVGPAAVVDAASDPVVVGAEGVEGVAVR
jgi:hypothetical protein